MKNLKVLTALGLTQNEISAYQLLLRYGTLSTSRVAQILNMNRGAAYVALHGLLERGVTSKIVEGNITLFSAQPPSVLKDIYTRKLSRMQQSRIAITELLPRLKQEETKKKVPTVQYFKGVEGAIQTYRMLKECKTKLLRLYLSPVDGIEFIGAENMNDITNWRIGTRTEIRTIRPFSAVSRKKPAQYKYSVKTKKSELREVRHLPEGYNFQATQYIYDDTVAMITSKKEGYSVIIKSQECADLQRTLFDHIWQQVG